MKNKIKINLNIIALLLLTGIILQGCSTTKQNEITTLEIRNTENSDNLQEEGINEIQDSFEEAITEVPSDAIPTKDETDFSSNEIFESGSVPDDLSEDEMAGLIFMREEEKLAKDVYLGLFDLWNLGIFQNIAASEQTHTDAVKNLLDRYGIEDPADNSPAGEFTNQDLQNLYDELMLIGSKSLGDALMVGAAIEEIDILDLKQYLETTKNEEIQRVYENLLKGSENHLRAFTSNYERQTGEIYEPQYMNDADYNTIISSSNARGGRGRGNRP